MAERKPVVLVGGQLKELPAGDTLPTTPTTWAGITDKPAVIAAGADAAAARAAIEALGDAPSDGKTYGRKDAAWAEVVAGGGGGDLIRSARTSNTPIGAADLAALIDITSGTFSQTFDAVATLGDGWYCYLRNSGTGDITLDPNSTELIDGLASYVMYPGECRLVQCDGTTLRTVVLNSFLKTFTGSGDFVKPPGYSVFGGVLWSAGASGRTGTNSSGGGGGAGFHFSLLAQALGATETVVIGAGGAATTSTTRNAGGDSSFAGMTCTGANNATAGAGGSALLTVASAVFGNTTNSLYGGGQGASSEKPLKAVYGGGAGGGLSFSPTALPAGESFFGGRGGDSVLGSGTAQDGTAPGGGGGNSQSGTSGAGARGELRIWGII